MTNRNIKVMASRPQVVGPGTVGHGQLTVVAVAWIRTASLARGFMGLPMHPLCGYDGRATAPCSVRV